MTAGKGPLDERLAEAERILRHLPHRYPFLMVDRIESFEAGKEIVAVKNVSFNEPHFQGHFPGRPVMPGVLMVEAIAQASAILGYLTIGATPATHTFLLAGVEGAKFKRLVIPGDRLVIRSRIVRTIRSMIKMEGAAEVDGETACSATLMSVLVGERDG